ncbi:MAG: glutamate-5-semialdehyde dehydrogenase [Oscillospiraceae bacterium]
MLEALLQRAVGAKHICAVLHTQDKNNALKAIADGLIADADDILSANDIDITNARGTLPDVMLDRLRLTQERIRAMASSITAVAQLDDPIGELLSSYTHPNGMIIEKKRVPMGVIAIIYESRPNVTADAAALCIKSGNVCVLRGGKEAFSSNMAIVRSIRRSLVKCNICEDAVSYVDDASRESAQELMQARGYVDLLIPRGGKGLIRACVDNARVPCIETGTGINHIYIDKSADIDVALKVLINAKTSRPSVCNAAEVCLVHTDIADDFLPIMAKELQKKNVEMRLCEQSAKIINGKKADLHDFDTEFLDYILGVKIVDTIDEAIEHIAHHSTGHSDAIITSDEIAAAQFTSEVDSAAVYVNASTRFTDGGEFGFGCEMGISTQKLGARGPMGLCELTTYKYIIKGNGQIR